MAFYGFLDALAAANGGENDEQVLVEHPVPGRSWSAVAGGKFVFLLHLSLSLSSIYFYSICIYRAFLTLSQ